MRSHVALAVVLLGTCVCGPLADAAAQADVGAHDDVWRSSPGRQLAYAHMWRYVLPLNNPPVVKAQAAQHMRDDDVVLGVVVDGRARAYPWWILTKYHVANDMIGSSPVYVAICEVCTGGAAFSPIVDGHYLSFQLCGLKNGSFEICDWETRSRWLPFSGEAYEGRLKGTRLEQLPFVYMTWKDWKAAHPASTVVLGSQELRARRHGLRSPPGAPGIARALERTLHTLDDRLEPNALVFGLVPEGEGRAKAYPLAWVHEKGGLVQDEIDGRPVLVIARGDLGGSAYLRRIGGHTLDMALVSTEPFEMRDAASGALWAAVGTEVKSRSAGGQRLTPVRGYVTEWYEWVNNYPDTEVAGDAP